MTDTPVAIDIAIEPDAPMVQRSLADNARLLQNFPQDTASTKRITHTLQYCSGSSAKPT